MSSTKIESLSKYKYKCETKLYGLKTKKEIQNIK